MFLDILIKSPMIWLRLTRDIRFQQNIRRILWKSENQRSLLEELRNFELLAS